MTNFLGLNKSIQIENPKLDLLDRTETKEEGSKATPHNLSFTKAAKKSLESLVNEEPTESVPLESELINANELTEKLQESDAVRNTLGVERRVKRVSAFPESVKNVLNQSQKFLSLLEKATGIRDRVQKLALLQVTLEQLQKELDGIDPKADNKDLQTTELLKTGVELDVAEDSLDASKAILEEIARIKTILPELHEEILTNTELTARERRDLLDFETRVLQDRIKSELQENPTFLKLLAQSDEPDGSLVLDAASLVLARIELENPHQVEPLNFADLFSSYRQSHETKALPENFGNDPETRLVVSFKKDLIELARASFSDSGLSAKAFCEKVDQFVGFDLVHFAVLGLMFKRSLAPSLAIRQSALAQHSYQVALKTLFEQLPKKEEEKLRVANLTTALTGEGLHALRGLKHFKDLSNQISALVSLQHQIICAGLVDLEDVVKGFSGTEVLKLDAKDEASVRFNREWVASALLQQLAESLDNVDLFNLIGECKNVPLINPTTQQIDQKHQLVIDKLDEIASDYLVRTIRGESDEAKTAKHLKLVSKSLTGTYFSGNYLKKVYDLNISNKAARVMDGVLLQLTGVLDPVKRGLLLPGVIPILETLQREMQNTIQASLRGDAVERLRVTGQVGKERAALLLDALLFDRSKAEGVDFDLIKTGACVEQILKDQKTVYSQIEGTRRRIIQSIKNEADFAEQNGLAVKIHQEKKDVNAVYKARNATADKVHTFFWKWGTRRDNATKILELKSEYDKLRHVDPNLTADQIQLLADTLADTPDRVAKLFGELQDLNLADFSSHNSKEKLSIDEFLKQAVPLAEAIDYVYVSGQAKEDFKQIKELKKMRNAARDKLKVYVDEAKKAYGPDAIRQIQRTVVLSAYMSERDNPGSFNNYASRLEATVKFMKANFPSMAHCDEGILGELVKDAVRRFTPPVGPMSHRYLDLIEAKLGSGHSASERIKKEESTNSKEMLEEYKTLAEQMYMKRGIEGLMTMIEEPGRGFSYNKSQSFTVSSSPAFMQASFSFMPSESFCVTHTEAGYKVLVKSAHADKIAASIGFKFGHSIKALGMIRFDVKVQGAMKFGTGLELVFPNAADTQGFVKDFMDPTSKLHTGELYNPTWHKSVDMKWINDSVFSGSIGASAKAMFRVLKGGKYTNQLHAGTQDYRKAQTIEDYIRMVNPTNGGNKIAQLSVKLPSAKIEASVSGSHTRVQERSHETTTTRTSSTAKLDVMADLTPIQFHLNVMPVTKLLWMPINEVYGTKDGKILIDNLINSFIDVDNTLTGEKQQLIRDKLARALDSAQKGEVDDANALLQQVFSVAAPEALDRFISLSTDNPHIRRFQQVLKILQVDSSLSQIGLFKAGGPVGKSNDRGEVRVGVKVDLSPSSVIAQLGKQVYKDVTANNELTQNIDATGLAAMGQNKQDPTKLQKFVHGVETVATYASTIQNIFAGNPMLAAANLIGMTIGSSQVEVKSSDNTKATVDVNAKDIVSFNVQHRGKAVESDFKAGLLSGVSAHAAIHFTGTAQTEHIEAYDGQKHQYLEATGIDYKVTKSKFSLDNLLELLNLPEAVAAELKGDEVLMTALLKAFLSAGRGDVFTLKTRLSPEALRQVNELEMRKSTRPEAAKQIQKQIRQILEAPENYVPVAFNVTHNDVKELRLALELSEIDLGVFAYGHHRDFTTTKSTTVSLRGLKSVQDQLGGKTVFESPIVDELEENTLEDATKTEAKEPTEEVDSRHVIDTSRKDFSESKAQGSSGTEPNVPGQNGSGAVPALNQPKDEDALRQFSNAWKHYVRAHAADRFTDEEARSQLLEKLGYTGNGLPDGFLVAFAKLANPTEALKKLDDRYLETLNNRENNAVYEKLKNETLGMVATKLSTCGLQGEKLNDFRMRLEEALTEHAHVANWLKVDPSATQAVRYFEMHYNTVLTKFMSDATVKAVSVQHAPCVVHHNPSKDKPVAVGTVFGQHVNTCFMMSVANALASNEEGALYLNKWLVDHNVESAKDGLSFSHFEQTLAEGYQKVANSATVLPQDQWNLGRMGEGDLLGDHMGLFIKEGMSKPILSDTGLWKIRELWCDVGQALRQNKFAILYTEPNFIRHYRAVVGTYGDPYDPMGDFGFILRDSSGQKDELVSAREFLQAQTGRAQVTVFSLPEKKSETIPQAQNLPQSANNQQVQQGAPESLRVQNLQEPRLDALDSDLKDGDSIGEFNPDTGINGWPEIFTALNPKAESWYRKLISGEHEPLSADNFNVLKRVKLNSISRWGLTQEARLRNAMEGFENSAKTFLDLFNTSYTPDMVELVNVVHQGLQYEARLRELGQEQRSFFSEVNMHLRTFESESQNSSGASAKNPLIASIQTKLVFSERFDALRWALLHEMKTNPARKDLLAVSEFLEEFIADVAGQGMLRKDSAKMLADFIAEGPFDTEHFKTLFLQNDKFVARVFAHQRIDEQMRVSPLSRFNEQVRSMSNEQLALFWERLVSEPVVTYARSLNGSSDATEQAMAQWFFDVQALALKEIGARAPGLQSRDSVGLGSKALDESFEAEFGDTLKMAEGEQKIEGEDISVYELLRRVENASRSSNAIVSLSEVERAKGEAQIEPDRATSFKDAHQARNAEFVEAVEDDVDKTLVENSRQKEFRSDTKLEAKESSELPGTVNEVVQKREKSGVAGEVKSSSKTSEQVAKDSEPKEASLVEDDATSETTTEALVRRSEDYVRTMVLTEPPFDNPIILSELRDRLIDRIENALPGMVNGADLKEFTPEACVEFFLEEEKVAVKRNFTVKAMPLCQAMKPLRRDPTPKLVVAPGDTFPQHYHTCFIMSLVNALSSNEAGCVYLNQWIKAHCGSDFQEKDNAYSDFERHVLEDYQKIQGEESWKRFAFGDVGRVAQVFGLQDSSRIGLDASAPVWKQRAFWCDVSEALRSGRFVTLLNGEHYVTLVGTYGEPYAADDDSFGFIVRDTLFNEKHESLIEKNEPCAEYRVSVASFMPIKKSEQLVADIFSLPKFVDKPDVGSRDPEAPQAHHGSIDSLEALDAGAVSETNANVQELKQPASVLAHSVENPEVGKEKLPPEGPALHVDAPKSEVLAPESKSFSREALSTVLRKTSGLQPALIAKLAWDRIENITDEQTLERFPDQFVRQVKTIREDGTISLEQKMALFDELLRLPDLVTRVDLMGFAEQVVRRFPSKEVHEFLGGPTYYEPSEIYSVVAECDKWIERTVLATWRETGHSGTPDKEMLAALKKFVIISEKSGALSQLVENDAFESFEVMLDEVYKDEAFYPNAKSVFETLHALQDNIFASQTTKYLYIAEYSEH